MRRVIFSILLLMLISLLVTPAFARDGIPDNCENLGAHQNINLIPRYEPNQQRLVLLNWTSGDVEIVLEENFVAENFVFRMWSPSCRYLMANINNNSDDAIWDVLNPQRVITIPATHSSISWSPDENYLLISSQSNLMLYHLMTGEQFLLIENTEGFDFESWDMATHTVRFEDNIIERMVSFDILTGRQVGNFTPSAESISSQASFSFGNYDCIQNGDVFRLHHVETHIELFLSSANGAIVLREGIPNGRYTYTDRDRVMHVIEGDTGRNMLISQGWSSNCRYAAGALGTTARNDTIIWDVQSNQRINTWADARNATHPLYWSPVSPEIAIIQTRNGVFLWNVLSDTRTLISDTAFVSFEWRADEGRFFAIRRGDNAVTAYDIHTGVPNMRYHIGDRGSPLAYQIQGDWMLVYTDAEQGNRGAALWNLRTNAEFQMNHPVSDPSDQQYPSRYGGFRWGKPEWEWAVSPDGRYFIVLFYQENLIKVWDTQDRLETGQANIIRELSYVGASNELIWIDNHTIEFGTGLARWDFLSGEQIGESSLYTIVNSNPQVVSVNNSAGHYGILSREVGEFGSCPFIGTANRSDTFPRLDQNNHRLVLSDMQSNVVHILEEDYFGRITNISWSPTCRYVTVSINRYYIAETNTSYGTITYDVLTGQRIGVFTLSAWGMVWNASETQAIIVPNRFTRVDFLWDVASTKLVQLENVGRLVPNTFYWDEGRGQIYVTGWAGVFAYDMITGEHRQTYTRPHDGSSRFIISSDGSTLVAFTFTRPRGSQYDGLTVWNLNTLENVQINVEDFVPRGTDEVQISADNRYLAIRGTTLRIWDLWSLPQDLNSRLPIYRMTIDDSATWSFDSVSTITTNTGGAMRQFDLSSGQWLN